MVLVLDLEIKCSNSGGSGQMTSEIKWWRLKVV